VTWAQADQVQETCQIDGVAAEPTKACCCHGMCGHKHASKPHQENSK
jgi:hypothetical protein